EHEETNLKYESVKGLFDQSQTLFVHANNVKQILSAIDFVKEFHFKVVLVGAEECYRVAPLLKENNMAVILLQPHQLPDMADDDIDQPYKNAAVLQKAGVLFAISDEASDTRGRNLPFNAGTAATYGLTKEEALAAITLNAAKILNIADKTGSLEAGKDANIVISKGDILDMRKSIISRAFIQGRQIDLTNKQTLLYEKYMQKYNLK
ncbi:MAG: amidohydrolase family protein, partial [Chitinophagaceae bacterium]|nr:amidohydrolase family protein [Chitinophagaceae bacterium]